MQSRKQKIVINTASSAGLMMLATLLSFATRIVFLSVLNESYLGISSLFTNVLGVLSLADLGIGSAMTYSLYQPLAEDDTEKIATLVGYFKTIYHRIAAAVFLVGVALIPVLPYVINLEQEIEYINLYYFIALMNTVVSYLYVYRTVLISADQKQYVVNNISFVFRLLTFSANLFVLIVFRNYTFYLLSTFFLAVTNNVVLNHRAMKMYPYLKKKAKPIEAAEKSKITENVKSLFIYKFSGTLVGNADNILTSVLVSTTMVGFYSNYYMIVTHVATMLGVFFGQSTTTLGNKLASNKNDTQDQLRLFRILQFSNFWIVGFSSIAFFVLLGDFVALVFGDYFVLSEVIVWVMVLNFYTDYITRAISSFRQSLGIFKEMRYITVVTAAINMAFSVLLGYFFGLAGILFATTLSRLLYSAWKEPVILFKIGFHASSKIYFVDYIGKVALCLLAGFVTQQVACAIPVVNVYLNFVCKVVVCSVLPNIIFLVVLCRTEEFAYFKDSVVLPALYKLKKMRN